MRAEQKDPPGALPPGSELPRERQTARMVMRPLRFLEELHGRHGDLFTVRVLDEDPWVVVADPELIGQVFRAPSEALHAGAAREILRRFLGEHSVMLLDGDRHLEQRRLLLPPFSGNRVERYEEEMRAATAEAIEGWPQGKEEPAAPWTRAIALEVILRTVFGVSGSRRLTPLREALREVRIPQNAREGEALAFRRTIDRVDSLLLAEIAERRDGDEGDHEDVLSLLLAARHEDGAPMSDAEIRDELMTLLAAGYETTATTLAWALELLAHDEEAQERTAAEAAGGGPYTEGVVRETLRIRPALPVIVRVAQRPLQLGDWELPAGTTIMPAILLVHHRPDIYPEPDAFRPERFLNRQPDPGAWMPFGGGVRRCIGASFALREMRVVLAALLARAVVRPGARGPEPMRRRDITLTPARGARLVLRPR